MSNDPQKKPATTAQSIKKITIKQFEWYEVQTKVRELLTELLQPFTKKNNQDTVKLNEFKRNLTALTKKLQDHDFLLNQESAQKPTYVQLQDDKILQIQKRFVESTLEQNKKIAEMHKIIEIYQSKITQVNQIESRIDQQTKQRSEQFNQHKSHIDQQMDLMLKKLDNQDAEINNFRQTSRNALTKVQAKTMLLENRANSVQDELKRRGQDLKRMNDQIININQKLAALDLFSKDLDTRLAQRQKDYKLSQKFMSKAIQLQNSVSFVQNYVQYYQPLYTQMQISQTINSFLKGTMKTRACLFEQKLFAHMHYTILTMDPKQQSLQSRMSDYSNRIRRIINRNRKYIIRMKVQEVVKYGNNVYEIREIDQAALDGADQRDSKPPTIIVPEEQITKIVQARWEKNIAAVSMKIQQKTQPFRVWIKQLQEQAILRQVDLQNKSIQLKSKLEKQEINMELFKGGIQQIQKQVNKSIDNIYKQMRKSKEQIKDIVNFSSVLNHIVIQDQIDRQGLALYALKSGAGSKQGQNYEQSLPNIHLDQKCVSCQNGNSSMIVNQAFKMACLAYNPSQIKVDDKVFTRQEILEISTNILDKLKKKLEQFGEMPIDRNYQTSTVVTVKSNETKTRSKSLLSKQLNSFRGGQFSTLDAAPQSSRLRDTTYLLPVLGSIKKKSYGMNKN